MRTMVDGVATYPRGTGGPSVLYLPGAGLVGLDFLNLTDDRDCVVSTEHEEI